MPKQLPATQSRWEIVTRVVRIIEGVALVVAMASAVVAGYLWTLRTIGDGGN